MRSFLVSAGVAIVILSLGASAVLADVIPGPIVTKNGATTLFQTDGFESDTTGAAPSVTTTGSWTLENPTGGGHSLVYAGGGTRPASTGVKLLEVADDSGVGGNTHAKAVFGSTAATTDTVQANFDVYVDSNGGTRTGNGGFDFMATFLSSTGATQNWWGVELQDGLGGVLDPGMTNTGMGSNDMFVKYYPGGDTSYNTTKASDGTNMYMTKDAWHSVQLNLIPNTSFTVTIDGVLSNSMGLMGTSATDIGILDFRANVAGRSAEFYLDGPPVPEPSVFVLLATGAIGLLAYAWRKRK